MDSDASPLQDMLDDLRSLIEQLTSAPTGQLSSAQIQIALEDLHRVDEKSIRELGYNDSLCPICLTPYNSILSEEETALAMDSPAHPIEELGIARLAQSWQCGHIFCRRDITKWITNGHDSCPMCRRPLLQQQGSSQTDEESARAEASAQAVDRHVREIEQFMRRELLRNADHGLQAVLHNSSTSNDIIEQGDGEPHPYSGMYS